MAKRVNSAQLKGILDVSFDTGVGTVTEIVKDEERVYNLFELLEEFNNKHITISIKEENDIAPVEE